MNRFRAACFGSDSRLVRLGSLLRKLDNFPNKSQPQPSYGVGCISKSFPSRFSQTSPPQETAGQAVSLPMGR